MVFSGQNMSVVGFGSILISVWEMETLPINIYQALQKAKNLKTNYKKIIVFNIVLFLKMNEQVGESGANRWETEQEKACKKQEEKYVVQVDLLEETALQLVDSESVRGANVQQKEIFKELPLKTH